MRYSCKEDGSIVNRLETSLNEAEKAGEGRMDRDDKKGVPSCVQTPMRYETRAVKIIMGDKEME